MELKKIILAIFLLGFDSANRNVKPAKIYLLTMLLNTIRCSKNNDDKDNGIKQTWIFAHPDNKKMTGHPRFR